MASKTPKSNDSNAPKSHDTKGRFAKGNKGGPGNPYAKKVAEFRTAIYESVTKDDLKAIVEKAVSQAKGGDKYAREWLWDRVLGKAQQSLSVETTTEAIKAFVNVETDKV